MITRLLSVVDAVLSAVERPSREKLLRRTDVQAAAVQRGADAFRFADQLAEEEAENEVREGCSGPSMCTADCARFGCRRDTAYGTSGQPEDIFRSGGQTYETGPRPKLTVPQAPAAVGAPAINPSGQTTHLLQSMHGGRRWRGRFGWTYELTPDDMWYGTDEDGKSVVYLSPEYDTSDYGPFTEVLPEFVGSGVEAIPVEPSPQTTPEPALSAEVCRAHHKPDCKRCDEFDDDQWIHPLAFEESTTDIQAVLEAHRFSWVNHSSIGANSHCQCGYRPTDLEGWEEHIAPLIADAVKP